MDEMVNCLLNAIFTQDIEKFKEIVSLDESIWNEDIVIDAITGTDNTAFFRALIDVFSKKDREIFERMDLIMRIPFQAYDEAKKIEIIDLLLPHSFDSNPPTFFDIFELTVLSCMTRNFGVTSHLIEHFYAEQHNSLYRLIKRLESVIGIEAAHYIAVLLHDALECLSDQKDTLESGAFDDFGFFVSDHVHRIVESFAKLLLQQTPESMKLACETLRELLKRNLYAYAKYFVETIIDENSNVSIEDPRVPKLCFQLIFNTLNAETETRMGEVCELWEEECPEDVKIYQQVREVLRPFEIWDSIWDLKSSVPSLKDSCCDVIREAVKQHVNGNKKDFLKALWSLFLPMTVKCDLMRIPDPTWMDGILEE